MSTPQINRHARNNRRGRSRSSDFDDARHEVRHKRSRSPRREHHHRHHHHRHRSPPANIRLPFHRTQLRKSDLAEYRNLLADYLDVQKNLDVTLLSEDEVKGRWKSFLGKWNRKELAEGWYDPDLKARVDERFASQPEQRDAALPNQQPARSTTTDNFEPIPRSRPHADNEESHESASEDEDNDYGPSLPSTLPRRSGPTIPRLDDLQHRNDLSAEARIADATTTRADRRLERRTQQERLDELTPRADPGSRERQLEKRRAVTEGNRAFRAARSPGAEEVGDREAMGGDGDGDEGGVDAYRARLRARERIKNEREIRKEEVLRARAAEREERVAEHRRKEEKTMEALKAIARQRFG